MHTCRNYEIKDGIHIFDSHLDPMLSSYDSAHLDEIAQNEERHFWFTNRRNKICQTFQQYVGKESRILEIGGGTGFVAEKLKSLGFSIEMADIYSNGLQYAKKRGIKKLYQFDLFNPPFNEEFDVICLFDVLEHLSEEHQALESVKKMLKPGGKIILTVPAHEWLWNSDDVVAGHQRRYTKKHLGQVFHASNLSVVQLKYFFISIVPLLYLRTWVKKDTGLLLEKQNFEIKINPSINKICDYLTKSEFYLDKWIPNVMGGSLLGIAQKEI